MLPERDSQIHPSIEGTVRPDSRQRLTPSVTWEQLIGRTEEWPKLDTPLKRLQAVLNVAKNGAMVLEVLALTDKPEPYTAINKQVNSYGSDKFLLHHRPTQSHFKNTLEDIGIAARGSTDDRYWVQTAFGREAKPALLFVSKELIGLDANPKTTLGAQSQVKTDAFNKESIITSPALSRFQILIMLYESGSMRREDIFDINLGISRSAVVHHLSSLSQAGLVEYEGADMTEGYVRFNTISTLAPEDWETPSTGRRIATAVAKACVELEQQGLEINYKNVIGLVEKEKGKLPNYGLLGKVFEHFTQMEYLTRGQFGHGVQSDASLTEKGKAVVEGVFAPLWSWCQDPNPVAAINEIRGNLVQGLHRYQHSLDAIADNFVASKNRDLDSKLAHAQVLIGRGGGMQTGSSIARTLGISRTHGIRITKRLIEAGYVQPTAGKGKKRLLSSPF